MADDHRQTSGAVDYKTLFAGTCVLVSLLGGALWNVWNQASRDDIADNLRQNQAQWERIRALNDQLIETRFRQDSIRKDLDTQRTDFEQRLRALEHKWK